MTAGSKTRQLIALVAVCAALAPFAHAQVDTWSVRGGNLNDSAARDRIAEVAPELSGHDVLLILVDGLEAGSLACFGGDGRDTRQIDGLAREAFTFTNAFAVSPHRMTAVLSILTSQYPATLDYVGDMSRSETVATMFRDRGYRCFLGLHPSVIDARGEPVGKLTDSLGFDRRAWSRARNWEPYAEMTADHLATRRLGEPLFGVLHYGQAYPPAWFHPGKDFGTSPEGHRRAAIAYVNDGITGIVEALRKEKTLDKTIIVITAPNAIVGNTGRAKHRQDELTDESLRVPLIVRIPGLKGRVIDDVIETIEIVPTLMTLLDHDHDYSLQGRSFADLLFDVEKADAPPRYAVANHIPFLGENRADARTSVRDRRWRLTTSVGLEGAVLTDTQAPEAGDLSAASPETIAGLIKKLEDVTAFNHACCELWRANRQEAPDLSPAGRLATKASWLAAIGDPRSTDAVRELIESGRGDMLTAIKVLLLAGDEADVPLAEKLLDHGDTNVAALAGAFLVAHGKSEMGLDYAIAGLRTEVSADVIRPILKCLAVSATPRARAAIERYTPATSARGLAAQRDLALARLGSEEARDRLAEHLLAPHVNFDRTPFIDAIQEYRPEKRLGLLSMCLTDGDPAYAGTMLQAIANTEGARPARAVAAALDNTDPSVRARAFSMLREWGSLAGHRGAVKLLRGEDRDLVPATWALLSRSALIGSPLLPGVRFDLSGGQFVGEGGRMLSGLPDVGSAEFEITVSGVDAASDLCAFVFWMPENVTPDDLKVRVKINEGLARTIEVAPVDNLWVWIGAPPATRIENGANRISLSIVGGRNTTVEALATAFAFLPLESSTARPLAAIETLPLLDRERPTLQSTTEHDADTLSYHLWLAARNSGRDGKADRVIVKIDGEIVVSGALPRPFGRRRLRVPIPAGTRHGAPIEIIYEDRSPDVNAVIVLHGER